MAMMALNVFATVFGVATMIPFLITMIPKRADLTTTVRIFAGTGLRTEGAAPHVSAWDIGGTRIGSAKGGDGVIQGAPYDATIEIDPEGSDTKAVAAQAMYISLGAAGTDSICIAGLSVTWPDGISFAWYGDIAQMCGAPWFYSKTILSAEDLYTPKCMWMDADMNEGIGVGGMGLHLPSFAATAERAESMRTDPDLWCKARPRLAFYKHLTLKQPIPYFHPPLEFEEGTLLDVNPMTVMDPANWKINMMQNPTAKEREKDKQGFFSRIFSRDLEEQDSLAVRNVTEAPLVARQLQQEEFYSDSDSDSESAIRPRDPPKSFTKRDDINNSRFPGKLIKSRKLHHSAKELCESGTSVGPDLLNLEEGCFCDMSAKKLWPICNKEVTSSCFNTETNQMVGGTKNRRRDDVTGTRIVRKRYVDVDEW